MKSSKKIILISISVIFLFAFLGIGVFGIVNAISAEKDSALNGIIFSSTIKLQAGKAKHFALKAKEKAEQEKAEKEKEAQEAEEKRAAEQQKEQKENSGETYVDVNISTQTLVFYVNGQVEMTTPVVTGCVAEGCDTPTGNFAIYGKTADTVLTGPTWNDHVDYWMPFYGAYGLHDADGWRSEYGGSIYQQNGSHGCVNMPSSAAGVIFQKAAIGTPVYVHY